MKSVDLNAVKRAAAVALLCTLMSCASPPHLLLPDEEVWNRTELTSLLAAQPLAAGDNIRTSVLGRTESLSYHLVQIRDRERPHLHASHDASVTLMRGSGELYIAGQPHAMSVGDVAVIRRGTPHYFVNSGNEPAVAFAAFVPPYDGTDVVPVD